MDHILNSYVKCIIELKLGFLARNHKKKELVKYNFVIVDLICQTSVQSEINSRAQIFCI